MDSKLLVDADHFMADLDFTIREAKQSVQVQTMTFEGDGAGQALIGSMLASGAKRKQLLIDSYSKAVINDHFVFGPQYLRSEPFRKEVLETKKLIRQAIQGGIEVRFTNPLGFLMSKYPLRNHKKMVIVDKKISYIGGINFSDHNFAWHDAMVRLEEEKIGQILSTDFDLTWEGINQSGKVAMDNWTLFFLNGAKSKKEYETLFSIIRSARVSIDVFSPYVSDPLLRHLQRLDKKVKIRIITPGQNNKSIFKKYLNGELKKGYFELLHYRPGMSHLKAILIDNTKLIMGSSNFDVVSYHFEQEVVLVSESKPLIAEFIEKVLEVDLLRCDQVDADAMKRSFGVSSLMHILNRATHFASQNLLKTK